MLLTTLAAACPNCAAGRAARGLVFSESFWTNVTYALLPFIVVMLLVQWTVRRVDRGAGDE